VKDFFGILEQQISRLGDQYLFAHAQEKRTTQFFFELLDVLADGGLLEVKLLAGAGEPAALSRRLKNSQLVQIH
jgi:hypothetical protein